jgi:magnesium-transporting ATPase (P-type)
LEQNLEFLGLIIMENKLKSESFQAISNLKNANIRTIMCTGDNILTALSVAHDCRILDSQTEKVFLVEAEANKKPNFVSMSKVEDLKSQVINFKIFLQACRILSHKSV